MAAAFGIYKKESGSPDGPPQLTKRLPGDFQNLEDVKGTARQEQAQDGYVLDKVYFLGEYSPI